MAAEASPRFLGPAQRTGAERIANEPPESLNYCNGWLVVDGQRPGSDFRYSASPTVAEPDALSPYHWYNCTTKLLEYQTLHP